MLLSRYLDIITSAWWRLVGWDNIPLLRSQSPVPPMCWTYPRWRWEYCCHKAGPVMTTVTLSVTPPSWHDRVWQCPVITAATHIEAYYNNAALLHLGILLERGIERQTYMNSAWLICIFRFTSQLWICLEHPYFCFILHHYKRLNYRVRVCLTGQYVTPSPVTRGHLTDGRHIIKRSRLGLAALGLESFKRRFAKISQSRD